MSLSNPKTSNPTKKFIEWSGSRGQFEYYDKDVEAKVVLPVPIYLVVLDQLSTVSGFDEPNNCGIYSNEVHDLTTELLVVKSHKGGLIVEGFYNQIKDKIGNRGGKYTKSVYACQIAPNSGDLELVNLKFSGSSLGPWIDARVGDDGCVWVLDINPELFVKGKTEYYSPTVTKNKRREDILEKAKAEDINLQAYFMSYKQQDQLLIEEVEQKAAEIINDLPF